MQRVGPIQDKTSAQDRYRQRRRFEEFLARHSSLQHFANEGDRVTRHSNYQPD
jgi:hypothetical protein